MHVRDSKYRGASPRLALAAEAWAGFVAGSSAPRTGSGWPGPRRCRRPW
ncbi:DUF397 domain-containing protein [Streptomyces sp. CS113]